MSHGTTITLYRKSRAAVLPSMAETLAGKEESRWKDCVELRDGEKRHGRFLCTDDAEFDMLDEDTGVPYNEALSFTFNSLFDEMREELSDMYSMSSYSPSRRKAEISRDTAKEMLAAANYVLLGHYDEGVENAFSNRFIKPLGSMSAKYSEWNYRRMFPKDDEPYREEDNSQMVEDVRCVMQAFLRNDDIDEYVLVVETWG